MGCSSSNTVGFLVNSNPTITVSNFSTCPGTAVTFSAGGANTYIWQPGNLTGSVITTSNTTSMIFTVTGSNLSNCANSQTASLHIWPPFSVTATCNSPICAGQTASFSTGAYFSYQWQGPGSFNSSLQAPVISNVPVSSSGNYSVISTDINGCKSSAVVNLIVYNLPQLILQTYTTTICAGQPLNISAFGANTYTWDNGTNSSTLQIAPTTNTVIQVSGTDSLTNCFASASLTVTVKKCNQTGLDDEIPTNTVVIFPNPNQGEFIIQIPVNATYKILSASGSEVLKGQLTSGKNVANLNHFAKGLYIIYINFETQTILRKVAIE